MKQTRKTYGVYGMMEYEAMVQMGRSRMKVLFTDGSVTATGSAPAKYSTSDLMTQMAIEQSTQYKRGLIKLISAAELEEDVKIMRNAPKPRQAQEKDEEPEQTGVPACGAETKEAEAEEMEAEAEETEAEAEEAGTEAAEESLDRLEFDNNDDARDWLEAEYGLVRSRLKTRADIIGAAATVGVEIGFSR